MDDLCYTKTMKTVKLGANKISQYYRVSGYVHSLERVAKLKGSSIYPYLPNELAINRQEGSKLCGVEQSKSIKNEKIEPISPIQEDDCYA